MKGKRRGRPKKVAAVRAVDPAHRFSPGGFDADLARLADDGCPHGEPYRTRLTPEEVERVLAGHEALCWSLARKAVRAPDPHRLEDAAADCRLQLVKAARLFDPSRGMQFTTYATRVAGYVARGSAGVDMLRGVHVPANLIGKVEAPRVGSLDGPVDGPGSRKERRLIDLVAGPEEPERPDFPADFWGLVCRDLSGRERDSVLLHFREGLTYDKAGELLGVTKSAVQQYAAKALRKLRELSPHLAGYLA